MSKDHSAVNWLAANARIATKHEKKDTHFCLDRDDHCIVAEYGGDWTRGNSTTLRGLTRILGEWGRPGPDPDTGAGGQSMMDRYVVAEHEEVIDEFLTQLGDSTASTLLPEEFKDELRDAICPEELECTCIEFYKRAVQSSIDVHQKMLQCPRTCAQFADCLADAPSEDYAEAAYRMLQTIEGDYTPTTTKHADSPAKSQNRHFAKIEEDYTPTIAKHTADSPEDQNRQMVDITNLKENKRKKKKERKQKKEQ